TADVLGGAFAGISAAAPADVWAVGTAVDGSGNQSALLEHWDGTSWGLVAGPSGGTSASLNGIAALGARDAWAVGTYTAGGRKPLIEHWDGSTWTPVTGQTLGTGTTLAGVSAVGPQDIWAVGAFSNTPDSTNPVTEHWDGKSWTAVRLEGMGISNRLAAAAAFGSGQVWSVGDYSSSATAPARMLVDRLSPVDVLDSGGMPPTATASWVPGSQAWRVDPSDSANHSFTDNTGLKLFTSAPTAPGSTYIYTFPTAGSFGVTDTGTLAQQQAVMVPIQALPATAAVTSSFSVRWGWYVPSGDVVDVQVLRPGATSFTDWVTGTTSISTSFIPDAGPGQYSFRARLRASKTNAASGWSPGVTITAQ